MKSMAFATYWLMVLAVVGGISKYEQNLIVEPVSVAGPAAYSFHSVDCDVDRHGNRIVGVVSVPCAISKRK